MSAAPADSTAALDRARSKAYWRLLPILFACYVIAYVDRSNVSIAVLTMAKELPAFDSAVIGFGSGIFFWGYFLLEVPGSLIVEKWGARLWICRIMVTWGILAGLTALVKTPVQFYVVRFCLGLAEAGFFPGIVVFLTHWFPVRDRTRALALFFVATPVAQLISPLISKTFLKFGTTEVIHGVTVQHPQLLGLNGWQWVYIFWGIPAVLLGLVVFFWLKDRPADAKWLTPEERTILEQQLASDKAAVAKHRMTILQALRHPMVLALCFVYFCSVTGNYGIEFFLPSILRRWYDLPIDTIAQLIMLPPVVALLTQLFVGWNSDRAQERRWHSIVPILSAMVGFALLPLTKGNLVLTVICFMIVGAGVKAYLPAFWALPNLFLTGPAAAGSIGLINSVGNLGGFVGPTVVGFVEKKTGSFFGGIYYLCFSSAVAALVLFLIGVGRRETRAGADAPRPDATKA